jgi:2-polyprenyl-3-methyl-5-hydroxy-6-metoxy-1,4-benzoquinol methylase
MNKKWIHCNACGADAYKKLSKVGEWNIGKCAKCGLIYVNPIPFFEPTTDFSDISRDFQYTQYMHNKITPEIIRHDKNQLLYHMEKITNLTGQNIQPVEFLDVGCGSGASVRAATDLGWKATGIDIDPELIKKGRDQLNVDLRCIPLLEAGFKENQFNFIRLRDVIEHLPNPYDVLMEIKRLLIPGGIALFATPNEDGIPTQLRLLLGKKPDKVATVAPPHHLHGFSPKTLKRLFDRVGFKTLEIQTTTPVDYSYVTSNNMRSAKNKVLVGFWLASKAIGKGSMLIGWVKKEK